MNTVSKYDIADVVSHISGNKGSPESEASESSSFASLFAKAVETTPASKPVDKVAESGKNLPDSATTDEQIEGNAKLTSPLDQKWQSNAGANLGLTSALFSPFYNDPEISQSLELSLQESMGDGESLENISGARNPLKGLSTLEKYNQIIPKGGSIESSEGSQDEKVLNSLKREVDTSDQLVRVTTLKHKRPIILGPGQFINDELQSQALVNHFPDDDLLGDTKSLNASNLGEQDVRSLSKLEVRELKSEGSNNAKTFPSNIKSQIDEFEAFSNSSTSQQGEEALGRQELANSEKNIKNIELNNTEITDLERIVREDVKVNDVAKMAVNIESSDDIAGKYGNEVNFEPVRNDKATEVNDAVTKVSVSKIDTVVESQNSANEMNIKSAGRAIDYLNAKGGHPDVNLSKTVKENGLITGLNEKSEAQEFRTTENKSSLMNVTERPLVNEVKNLVARPEAGDLVIKNNESKNTTEQFIGLQNSQQPAVVSRHGKDSYSDANLVASTKDRVTKIADGFIEGSKKESYEIKGEPKRDSMGSHIRDRDAFEILIKTHGNEIKNVPSRVSSLGNELTQLDVDSSINMAKNINVEANGKESFVGSLLDKTLVSNRPEGSSKSVAVSNFSSEMRETIVGQLTNSAKGVSKFTVALFPENFGKISIEISYSENAGLKINMIGDNPEATRILEQNLPSLRENLQSERLSELIVNLNSNRDFQNSNNRNGKSENEGVGENLEKDSLSTESEESNSAGNNRGLALDSENSLDTYV
ncbi:MAG: flagellar hook-length control protein FliK [Gammaproteobacteria bacterium]|nr:flagellar hook-length control protein FliK [Gammaproteobacteria bacterium]